MYITRPTKQYRKSLKHLLKSGSFDDIELQKVIDTLSCGKMLELKYRNHKLQGEFSDCFECHLNNNLLFIYRIDEKLKILSVIDIGTHSDLFE